MVQNKPRMKKYFLLSIVLAFFSTLAFYYAFIPKENPTPKAPLSASPTHPSYDPQPAPNPDNYPTSKKKNKIQLALLLDTSNSMDGLIEQTKSQLWQLVNELASTSKNGELPGIEIALYEYGNDNLSTFSGYVRNLAPLTTDLDFVSNHLFNLKTNGGQEYCGWAMDHALKTLQWSDNKDDLKIIVIAGNEPFNQGSVDFKEVCNLAVNSGIIINTIFCGNYKEGERTLWKEGADRAKGDYLNIDQADRIAHVSTPFDRDINSLNTRLNSTYISYGEKGEEKMQTLVLQDSNAGKISSSYSATRSAFKAKEAYNNSDWDLVDAAEENQGSIASIAEEVLPQNMRSMGKTERIEFVAKKSEERKAIKKQILELEAQAKAYRLAQQKKQNDKLTLDNVMMKTIKEQAKEKGFVVE